MYEETPLLMWIGFNVFVLIMLIFDLFIHGRNEHAIGVKEAIYWSIFWICLALGFNVLLYYTHGSKAAIEFFTGYLVEKSLSVDNLFVFILIFSYFKTPKKHYHKVLFYGILGAIVMRAIFIFGGIAIVQQFRWLMYILGFFLLYVGLKIAFKKEEEVHPERNPVVLLFEKIFPIASPKMLEEDSRYQDRFFIRKSGVLYATPLFITLLTVELTDVIFAIDSIPAILAITLDPFIVYSSNIFAILGLRSLFFALEASLDIFHYLHYAIGAILAFIGLKMLLSYWFHMPTFIALAFIVLALTTAVIFSLLYPKKSP